MQLAMEEASRYFILDSQFADPARIAKERAAAKKLRKTQWWLDQLNRGSCYYCGQKFARDKLTMDHIVPLARGGTSAKGNIVPACVSCNQQKKLEIPAESLIDSMS